MQRRLIFGLLAVVTIWACDSATPSQPGTQAELSVVPVSVSAAPAITTLTITVSGSDIATDLVFNVELVNGAATDTVAVPAGSARTVTVRGFDVSGIETHRGSKTVNLVEGLNPQLTVVLDGLTGDQPLMVALGETTVTVTPETATVSVGGTEQLSAVVTDEAGDTLEVSVRWASSNPAIATVDATGLVTGVAAGSATVVGTYGGVGASVDLIVYDSAFPADGLQAFLPLGGILEDLSGNGHDLTPVGLPSAVEDRHGIAGGASYFPGDAYFEVDNAGGFDLPAAFTISLWVKAERKPDGRIWGALFGRFFDGASGPNYELNINYVTGELVFHTSSTEGVFSPDVVPESVWLHVAGVYDGAGTGTIWWNGRAVATRADLSNAPVSSVAPLIGLSAWGGGPFLGAMDDIRVYDRALTPEEIAYLANN